MQIRWMTVAGFGVATLVVGVIALSGTGCGDDDDDGSGPAGPDPVTFVGNLSAVVGETATESASLRNSWLAWVGPPQASAQEDECDAVSVLACAETDLQAETPTTSCSVVDPATCTFETAIVLAEEVEEEVGFFFVDDDGDGVFQPEEEDRSNLVNDLGNACEGQTITLTNVTVDFQPAGVALAESVEREPEECPTPTATPEPTATPTPEPSGDGDGDGDGGA